MESQESQTTEGDDQPTGNDRAPRVVSYEPAQSVEKLSDRDRHMVGEPAQPAEVLLLLPLLFVRKFSILVGHRCIWYRCIFLHQRLAPVDLFGNDGDRRLHDPIAIR